MSVPSDLLAGDAQTAAKATALGAKLRETIHQETEPRLTQAGVRENALDAGFLAGFAHKLLYECWTEDGSALVPSAALNKRVPLDNLPDLSIVGWRIEVDGSLGSATFEVEVSPATGTAVWTSICGGNLPTISSGDHAEDTTLTGWTKDLPKACRLRFRLVSCSGIANVTFALAAERMRR